MVELAPDVLDRALSIGLIKMIHTFLQIQSRGSDRLHSDGQYWTSRRTAQKICVNLNIHEPRPATASNYTLNNGGCSSLKYLHPRDITGSFDTTMNTTF